MCTYITTFVCCRGRMAPYAFGCIFYWRRWCIMKKLIKIIFDIIELFFNFSMMSFRSVPTRHVGFNWRVWYVLQLKSGYKGYLSAPQNYFTNNSAKLSWQENISAAIGWDETPDYLSVFIFPLSVKQFWQGYYSTSFECCQWQSFIFECFLYKCT